MNLDEIKHEIIEKSKNEKEFVQALIEVLNSLELYFKADDSYIKDGTLLRLLEPERIIIFRVPWVDDKGEVRVNRGFRVEHSSAIGPYKGGLRFHSSVNLSIMKFLAFEQTFKNALTGLPMGGGKGGSDFDPHGKSDGEIMRFCQSFMNELYRHIGQFTDVPAGDIGVGAREVGYLFGQYKRLKNEYTGVLTGKGLTFGGSLARKEATGYGLLYFTNALLNDHNMSLNNKKVIISGSGNVAIYAAFKAVELGAKVIAMSDSNHAIYDEEGLDLEYIKEIKELKRERIKNYLTKYPDTKLIDSKDIWSIKCDIALPCATQNEIDLSSAKKLYENGIIAVCEGANMPLDNEASTFLVEKGVLFGPSKAANAGGVMVSGLEMSQNSLRLSWTFKEVDEILKKGMEKIYNDISKTAVEYGVKDNLIIGANICGFKKVAMACKEQGIV